MGGKLSEFVDRISHQLRRRKSQGNQRRDVNFRICAINSDNQVFSCVRVQFTCQVGAVYFRVVQQTFLNGIKVTANEGTCRNGSKNLVDSDFRSCAAKGRFNSGLICFQTLEQIRDLIERQISEMKFWR